MLSSSEIRQKFVDFYKSRGHVHIPSAPLVPLNDPTTLLVNSGMQPLVPYLLGKSHQAGKRLVDSQICIRAQGFLDDMMEVGNNRHTTFFEMLGNWSLGDYFKKEQLRWVFEFLVGELGLDHRRLYVSVFGGDEEFGIPRDEESIEMWKVLFRENRVDAKVVDMSKGIVNMDDGRIFLYGTNKNWWSRFGPPSLMPSGELGGPDSEVFYDFGTPHDSRFGSRCHPNCDCGRFLEIANSVFMQYQKQEDGSFKGLPNKSVDFGAGLERLAAVVLNTPDVFESDLYKPLINKLSETTGLDYEGVNKPHMRVIADHIKSSVFLITSGIVPGNKMQGYILRKFLRRAAAKMYLMKGTIESMWFAQICNEVFKIYESIPGDFGFSLNSRDGKSKVEAVITSELDKFGAALDSGFAEFNRRDLKEIDAEFAFNLYQSYGFPFEIIADLLAQRGMSIDKKEFNEEFERHRKISR